MNRDVRMQNLRQTRNELRFFGSSLKIICSNCVRLAVWLYVLRFHVRRQLNVRDDAVDFRIQITRSHFAVGILHSIRPFISGPLSLSLTHSLSLWLVYKTFEFAFRLYAGNCTSANIHSNYFAISLRTMCFTIYITYSLPCGHRAFSFVCVARRYFERKNINSFLFRKNKKKIETKQKIARLQVNHIPRTPSFVYYSHPEEHMRSSFEI